jgi:hypothetical protein
MHSICSITHLCDEIRRAASLPSSDHIFGKESQLAAIKDLFVKTMAERASRAASNLLIAFHFGTQLHRTIELDL